MKKLLLLIPLFVFSLIIHAQAPSAVIAHYKLDNSLADSEAGGYNGALDFTTAVPDRFGAAGRATAFGEGISSGELPVELVAAMSQSFTLNFWMNTSMV